MGKFKTHYDNLMVTRNAPSEVITAAYRQLSLKYHPDRNPNEVNAQRIMGIINQSYATLSNPVKRREHDLWIETREKEVGAGFSADGEANDQPSSQRRPPTKLGQIIRDLPEIAQEIIKVTFAFSLAMGAIIAFGLMQDY